MERNGKWLALHWQRVDWQGLNKSNAEIPCNHWSLCAANFYVKTNFEILNRSNISSLNVGRDQTIQVAKLVQKLMKCSNSQMASIASECTLSRIYINSRGPFNLACPPPKKRKNTHTYESTNGWNTTDVGLERWCKRCWRRIHAGCWRCTESLAGRTFHRCTSYRRSVSSVDGSHSPDETVVVVRLLANQTAILTPIHSNV